MNYFQLFDINTNFNIDLDLLQSKYIELQRSVHPDVYNNDHSTAKKNNISSSQVNLAYDILKDDIKRGKYILKLEGINTDELSTQLDIDFYDDLLEDSEIIDNIVLQNIAARLSCTEIFSLEKIIKKRKEEYSEHFKSASEYYQCKQIDNFGTQIMILGYLKNLINKAVNILNSS